MRKLVPVSAAVLLFLGFFVDLGDDPRHLEADPDHIAPDLQERPPGRHNFSISHPSAPPHPAYDGPRERADRLGRRRRGGDRGGGAGPARERGIPRRRRRRRPRGDRGAREHHPDLVVLDLMLPGMDGLEVCKQIQRDGWTPVLMLTARTEEADKVAGFAVGADDYLTKPFSLRELTVRVKAILRRVDAHQGRGRARRTGRARRADDRRRAPASGGRRRGGRAHAARVRDPVRAWPAIPASC